MLLALLLVAVVRDGDSLGNGGNTFSKLRSIAARVLGEHRLGTRAQHFIKGGKYCTVKGNTSQLYYWTDMEADIMDVSVGAVVPVESWSPFSFLLLIEEDEDED